MSTREERIKERQARWAQPKQDADPLVRKETLEHWKLLAKLATIPEWATFKGILDDCARYRLIPFDEPNWDVKTAVEQGQVALARRLITLVEEAPDRFERLMTETDSKEGAA